jgi:hypothetical protein
MTTDNTFQLNAEATLQAMKQDRICVEAEAYTAGEMNLQRMLAEEADYSLLCKIVEQAKCFNDEDKISLTEIADNEFSNDLDFYPAALRGSFLDGFFSEAVKVNKAVQQ